jgi:hypothetical protein
MNKAWITYLGMLAVLGAGMWAILYAGSRLQAPPDLHGRYVLQWDAARLSSPKSAGASSPPPFDALSIEQSGLFFNVQLWDGKTLGAVLHGRWDKTADGSIAGTMRSNDGHWNLRLRQTGAGLELRGELAAPPGGAFTARKESENAAASINPG